MPSVMSTSVREIWNDNTVVKYLQDSKNVLLMRPATPVLSSSHICLTIECKPSLA